MTPGAMSPLDRLFALEQFRIKYLGTKGAVKDLMNLLSTAPKEQKRDVGQRVNAVKGEITAAFEERKASMGSAPSGPVIDVTEPGSRPQIGRRHILMQVVDELAELFGRMGFTVAEGPELEDDFHNFIANIRFTESFRFKF